MALLGSSANLTKVKDVCASRGIKIAGIIDSDYFGNTADISGIPVIDTEHSLTDSRRAEHYRSNYNFFCATNWTPEKAAFIQRDRKKRNHLINLLDNLNLSVISLIDPLARVASDATIGRGVFIDAFVLIEPAAVIQDYVSVYAFSGIGHHTVLMKNSVVQRHCSIASYCEFGSDTYVGTAVKALKTGARFGAGTFIHECVYIRRGTLPDEVISREAKNQSRVYWPITIQNDIHEIDPHGQSPGPCSVQPIDQDRNSRP